VKFCPINECPTAAECGYAGECLKARGGEASSKVAGPVGSLSTGDLLAAVVQWSEARKMRCLSCDEGQESAPCTCFDVVAAIDAAEKKLQGIADEAANR